MPSKTKLPRRNGDKLVLVVTAEDAHVLERRLAQGDRTTSVQINLTFTDQNDTRYYAHRVVRMKLRKEAGR